MIVTAAKQWHYLNTCQYKLMRKWMVEFLNKSERCGNKISRVNSIRITKSIIFFIFLTCRFLSASQDEASFSNKLTWRDSNIDAGTIVFNLMNVFHRNLDYNKPITKNINFNLFSLTLVYLYFNSIFKIVFINHSVLMK